MLTKGCITLCEIEASLWMLRSHLLGSAGVSDLEFGNCSARFSKPTVLSLRAIARSLHEGWRLNHSLSVAVKQSSTSWWWVLWMASSVGAFRLSANPMLYHLARPSHTIFLTINKLSTVRSRTCMYIVQEVILFQIPNNMTIHFTIVLYQSSYVWISVAQQMFQYCIITL